MKSHLAVIHHHLVVTNGEKAVIYLSSWPF